MLALYPLWLALASRFQPPPPAAPNNQLLTDILNRLASRLEQLEIRRRRRRREVG